MTLKVRSQYLESYQNALVISRRATLQLRNMLLVKSFATSVIKKTIINNNEKQISLLLKFPWNKPFGRPACYKTRKQSFKAKHPLVSIETHKQTSPATLHNLSQSPSIRENAHCECWHVARESAAAPNVPRKVTSEFANRQLQLSCIGYSYLCFRVILSVSFIRGTNFLFGHNLSAFSYKDFIEIFVCTKMLC